ANLRLRVTADGIGAFHLSERRRDVHPDPFLLDADNEPAGPNRRTLGRREKARTVGSVVCTLSRLHAPSAAPSGQIGGRRPRGRTQTLMVGSLFATHLGAFYHRRP